MIRKFVKTLSLEKVRFLCLLFIFFVIVVFAWQADDAYHAHRMSWNLLNGNGFTYNPGERVNATTSPLWTLMTTGIYAILGNVYWASMLLCFACSIFAIYIMLKLFCKSIGSTIIATWLLLFCTSFVSYTTSGLENPLLFLLSAVIVILFIKTETFDAKKLLLLSFASSLLITARMDNALIVLPLLVYAFLIKSTNKPLAILCGFIGMLPFIGWILFSLVYYGFPFPNTYYAKLSTGFPLTDYFQRGVKYFFVSGLFDPVVLIIPLVYTVFSCLRKDMKHIIISSGVVLYLAYVFYIGGCFMMGRHFTVPFFLSLFCLFDLLAKDEVELNIVSCFKLHVIKPLAIVLIASMFYQCINFHGVLNGSSGVMCERRFYYPYTSIPYVYGMAIRANASPHETMLRVFGYEHLAEIIMSGYKGDILPFAPGLIAYSAKNLYITDDIALGDPMLARLPAPSQIWRIGHIHRDIPEGYRDSVRSGQNKIVDPSLHRYYDVLRLIIQSKDLFAPERMDALINMNLGKYDYLIQEYAASRKWF